MDVQQGSRASSDQRVGEGNGLSGDAPGVGADPFVGTQYRALGQLGEGGMGEVFLVEHRVLERTFVAKILRPEFADHAALVDRMRVEAQALGALSNPHIVGITDFARAADGRPFFVMERLDGRTLGDELDARGYLPVGEAIGVVREVLAALAAAHGIGLIHRDLKLDNIFLHEPRIGGRVVKVLDFGVAKVLAGAAHGALAPPAVPTVDGAIVGTPRYASPEQILGRGIDHRADLYALGLVLYTLVAGRGPFDDHHGRERLFDAHLGVVPAAPSTVAPQPIAPELDAAILRTLEKRPSNRFASAQELDEVLAGIAERLPAADEPPSPTHASEPASEAPTAGDATEVAERSPSSSYVPYVVVVCSAVLVSLMALLVLRGSRSPLVWGACIFASATAAVVAGLVARR